jgi:hypothetical protein
MKQHLGLALPLARLPPFGFLKVSFGDFSSTVHSPIHRGLLAVRTGSDVWLAALLLSRSSMLWGRQYTVLGESASTRKDEVVAAALSGGGDDSSFLIAGHSEASGSGSSSYDTDLFISALSVVNGDVLWTRRWGSSGMDLLISFQILNDEYILLGGGTRGDLYSESKGSSDAFVALLSMDAELKWGWVPDSMLLAACAFVVLVPEDHAKFIFFLIAIRMVARRKMWLLLPQDCSWVKTCTSMHAGEETYAQCYSHVWTEQSEANMNDCTVQLLSW